MEPKYLRVIRKHADAAAPADPCWSVYIVRCGDGSLYTGIAKDVDARLEAHNAGRGAAYTRTRRPVALLYRKDGFTRSEALVREAGIKSLPRARKELLIDGAGVDSAGQKSHNGASRRLQPGG